MITVRRATDRGHADHGWLDTWHTFSFADYHDPAFTRFGVLRVINQDTVRAGRGFDTHGHQDMEIVTFVLQGVLEHQDSMGNGTRILPGEVQLMSAGTGVTHSEFNGSQDDDVHLLQMWVFPERKGTTPRYEQKAFAVDERRGRARLVVSPDGADGSLTIGQDARMSTGLLDGAERVTVELTPGHCAWLHVARGALVANGARLHGGDGAAVEGESSLTLDGGADAEWILWELPPR